MTVHAPIPAAPETAKGPRHFDPGVREYCRALLRRLEWPSGGSSRSLRTLGVTSCTGGEGVSTVAAHLAAAAAAWGTYSVLLVDANLLGPSVHETFQVEA